jgi:hypothetical protein
MMIKVFFPMPDSTELTYIEVEEDTPNEEISKLIEEKLSGT